MGPLYEDLKLLLDEIEEKIFRATKIQDELKEEEINEN